MELTRVDTVRAYDRIRERITTLDLAPGAPLNEIQLAADLGLAVAPVREALKLLAHENLVVITPRHGLYVAGINLPDLERLSELRLTLEGLSARLAAERATADDIVVLHALRREQATIPDDDSRRLVDVDHKFHQAIAHAAANPYLSAALERLFGLSQRLWYLALPRLELLPAAVHRHLDLVAAIEAGDPALAESIMREHVADFYLHVQQALAAGAQPGAGSADPGLPAL